MLDDFALPGLRNLPNYNELIFMQDGHPAHRTGTVVARLMEEFGPDRVWSMSNDPENQFATDWPARSPDLTACDYWAFAHLKSKFY